MRTEKSLRQSDRHLEADGEQVIDASGMVVLPGGIDVHTHFNIDAWVYDL